MSIYALGIDPGLASVGLAAVEVLPDGLRVAKAAVIRTAKADRKRRVRAADDNLERTRAIASELLLAIRTYRPVAICAESMSFPRNASTAAKMALCWGAIAGIAEREGLPILQATPQELKLAVAGSKAASKEEVMEAVVRRLGPPPLDGIPGSQREHAIDAIAAVIACEGSEVIRMARQMAGRGVA